MEGTMERATDMMHEDLPFPGSDPVQDTAQVAADAAEGIAQEAEKAERSEITIKFARGLCSEPFTAKDGKEYVQIKIPEEEKGIWPTFVLPAKSVHENQYGKGLWAKIPEDGTTKVRRTRVVGEDQIGKKIYDHQDERVPNKQLKAMVEAYKEKNKDAKPSINDALSEPVEKTAAHAMKPKVPGDDAR